MASQLPISSTSHHSRAQQRPQPILDAYTGFGPALAEAAERETGLPKGAWRRRRLFALRVAAPGFPELGVGRGDFLIVEPGQQANCDHLVVVRQDGTLLLRRVIGRGRGRRSILMPPESGTLPLPLPGLPPDVVGTVIGVLGKGFSNPGQAHLPVSAATAPTAVLRAFNAKRLESNLRQWWVWVGRPSVPSAGGPRYYRYRQMLGERLRILSSCMERANNRHLHAALLSEANRVIAAMQRDASDNHGPTLLELLPIASTANAAARH